MVDVPDLDVPDAVLAAPHSGQSVATVVAHRDGAIIERVDSLAEEAPIAFVFMPKPSRSQPAQDAPYTPLRR